ncbi:acetoacetate decarboxylase family protein [Tautonia plasticadhaerens]|uniref:Acetoacetate decarboxylase (ADC) n=1 Tax=Tautonia plasticadhaerens TaxID=2527974 RepID=A0A518H475_9BACT|nr:acetoacetate decarboxylase family protein [Tautonia plasticadhaerens]QDV35654.1 Acetoacetate decarboxylase (ADC) [Tautonia plasticadhaerens]
MGWRSGTGRLARQQPAALIGSIPRLGETWLPVGRKALVGAAYLAPVDLVRPLVPEELEFIPVLPGRTLATLFIADYGPGSTLEYHELGLQPALVRFRGVAAAWNSLLLVDSHASVQGGELLGFSKRLASFDWREEVGPGGRASGECLVRLNEQEVVRIRYRQGRMPLPGVPVQAMTIRDDMVLCFRNRLRGRYRWSHVEIEPTQDGPAGIIGGFGRPILTGVATGYQGVMGDAVRALGFLAHRHPG